jgi:hypothetical protein
MLDEQEARSAPQPVLYQIRDKLDRLGVEVDPDATTNLPRDLGSANGQP